MPIVNVGDTAAQVNDKWNLARGFLVNQGAGVQTYSNTAVTVTDLTNKEYDPENGFNLSTGKYTVPAAYDGEWMQLYCCFAWTSSNDFNIFLRLNGTTQIGEVAIYGASASTQFTTFSGLHQVSTGDTFEVLLRVRGGGADTLFTPSSKTNFICGRVL